MTEPETVGGPVRYDTFDAVNRLDGATLHQLLTAGDPAERVWAAWSLGLRLGSGFMPSITSEPDAGVRAQLVVMLAGANEVAAIRELADGDSDPDVRATACVHLHRLAKDGDKDVAAFLARRFRSDQSWTVRKRLVSLNLDREFLSGRDLAQALEDVDVSVRREAFRVDDDRFARLTDMGWPRFTDPEAEPDRELRSQFIARVLKLEGLSGALRRIEQHGTASSETWRALLNARMKADWDQLSFLADGNPDNESRLVDLLKTGGDEAAFGWLVRSLLEPRAIWREAIWHLVSLDAVEAPALAGVLAGLDRNDRMVVQARLLEYADEIRNYMMVEEDDDDAEWLSAVEALARTLS